MEKPHTGSPEVNPRRLGVAIKGTPTFLVKEKALEAPWMGLSWLVPIVILAIVSNSTIKKSLRSTRKQQHKEHATRRKKIKYPEQENKGTFQRKF